jgi:quercetin dioxygenase-like cupin family protein
MAIPHLQSGQVAELPLGGALAKSQTATLVKTDHLEVIRLALPAGKEIATHRAPGEITVQCLEGRVRFQAHGNELELAPGKFLYLSAGEPHALEAVEPSSVLVTILLGK